MNELELTQKLQEYTDNVAAFYEMIAETETALMILEFSLKDKESKLASTSEEYAALTNDKKRDAWIRAQTAKEQNEILTQKMTVVKFKAYLESAKIKRDYYATMIRLLIASKQEGS